MDVNRQGQFDPVQYSLGIFLGSLFVSLRSQNGEFESESSQPVQGCQGVVLSQGAGPILLEKETSPLVTTGQGSVG